MRHKKPRIVGWKRSNPPEVEFAFRSGFLAGVEFGICHVKELLFRRYDRVMNLRSRLYWGDRWSDCRAAWLRGMSHGLCYLHYCREDGGDVARWVEQVSTWAEGASTAKQAKQKRADAMPPAPITGRPYPKCSVAMARKVDPIDLLRRIAKVVEIPEPQVMRQGAWVVNHWWQLHVWIDREFRYRGQQRWLPGIQVRGCDPQGPFGRYEFVLFDELSSHEADLPRIDAFLKMFTRACRRCEENRAARHKRQRNAVKIRKAQEAAAYV